MHFVSKSLEQNLQSIGQHKVEDEALEIQKQRESKKLDGKEHEEDGGPQIVMMIGNGVGMFQIISSKNLIYKTEIAVFL